MPENFTLNKITPINEQIADELKNTRLQNKIKLAVVAERLKINIKYLRNLEAGELKKLPAGIYGRNFLKEYALFLKLDADHLLELFDSEAGEKNNQKPKNIFIKKTGNAHHFIIIPKIIKNLIIFSIIFVIVGYLAYSINKIVSPPFLIITNPSQDIVTTEHSIIISGTSESDAHITVNEEPVLMNSASVFEKTVNLKQGVNDIEIIAQKKYSKQAIINRKILVK